MTCNYEARRRGLHKLQLIREARKQCPDVVIVMGEDLTRFRDASKELYNFLKAFSWSGKVERLGFDEVSSLQNHHNTSIETELKAVGIHGRHRSDRVQLGSP